MALIEPHPEPQLEHDEQVQPAVRGGVALWTLFLGFTMLMVGNGLNLAVLGVRMVGEGRNAAGRGWIGLTPRNAYLTTNVTVTPLVSPWLFLLLAMVLTVAAWLREGRR